MYHFIVNITSGRGKAKKVWDELQAYLMEHQIRYKAHFTEYEGHASYIADRICSIDRSQVYLIVVGGDGSLHEVLNGMHHFEKVRFGYIPTGSGNDFARGMGILGTPIENLERILQAQETTPVDLGMVRWKEQEKLFAISSGLGMDAAACKLADRSAMKKVLNRIGLGSLIYVIMTLKALFTMPATFLELTVDGGESRRIERMVFIAAMNQYCEGGGVPMTPEATAVDGRLSICCAAGISRLRAFFLLPFLVKGKHTGMKGFEVLDCERYTVKLDGEMALHADGEYYGDVSCAEYICLPKKLHVLL